MSLAGFGLSSRGSQDGKNEEVLLLKAPIMSSSSSSKPSKQRRHHGTRKNTSGKLLLSLHISGLILAIQVIASGMWYLKQAPPSSQDLNQRQLALSTANSKATFIDISQQSPSFQASKAISPPEKDNKKSHYYAFIRIPKTGSTTMLRFLDDKSGLHSLDRILPSSYVEEAYKIYDSKNNGGHPFKCIYGEVPEELTNSSRSAVVAAAAAARKSSGKEPDCTHSNYHILEKTWNSTVPQLWNTTTSYALIPPDELSLLQFTLVREPFERLRSLFFYMNKFTNNSRWCEHCGTKEQYEMVEVGDFAG